MASNSTLPPSLGLLHLWPEADQKALIASSPTTATSNYAPRGAALKLLRSRRREVLLGGPAGTGKSRAALEKLHRACLKYPGIRCLIVRKTRESLSETGLVTFEQHVLPPNSPIKEGAQRRVRQVYTYPNGSEIVVGGMDKPSKIMSTEYDLIYAQEATELLDEDWEALTTRLRNGRMSYQQLLADCNPEGPQHWLKLRCDVSKVALHESVHEDNPRLHDGTDWTPFGREYIATLDQLTGVRKERLRYGRWVAATGTIYDFNRAIHLIDRFDIPQDWRRIRVIDFGYVHPFACQWWAIDPDGRLYLYREIYHSHRIVSEHAKLILALSDSEAIEATIADHDAEDRATLESCGIWPQLAIKEVSPGIQAVQQRLQLAQDGKPRLFVLRDSLVERDERLVESKQPFCTEHEFDSYVWAKDKEAPVKLHDEGMDCLRYAVMYLDDPSSTAPLFLW